MTIRFSCPQCGSSFDAPPHLAGNQLRCPQCKNTRVVEEYRRAPAIWIVVVAILLLCGGGLVGSGWFVLSFTREAAQSAQSQVNLRQIGTAIHDFHALYNKMPARANFDGSGKPLLSWRVHILPYIEGEYLYRQFHLDEPWDSPHNRQFISQMPMTYCHPGDTRTDGKTRYVAVTGKRTIFPLQAGSDPKSAASSIGFTSVTDGLSNTVMVIEVPREMAVTWTQPDDWEYTPQQLDKLASALKEQGKLNVLFGDGAVQRLSPKVDRQTLSRLFEIDDGQPVSRAW